jgi:FkbM family methyltransferase
MTPQSDDNVSSQIVKIERTLKAYISEAINGIGHPVENNVPALDDIRQRIIHTENKINTLLVRTEDDFRGSTNQRYGHITYSQYGEDLVFVSLLEQLKVENPTYLDIGANHPTDCSNTALLYRRGARGVNIDANPDIVRLLDQKRPEDKNVNVGVAGSPGELTFYRFDSEAGVNSFSRAAVDNIMKNHPYLKIMDELIIPVLTLNQIVDKFCDGRFPDLLSIDAEGFDYEILDKTIFTTRPKILCVETIGPTGEDGQKIDSLLIAKGFRKCIQMYGNGIYVDRDLAV